MIRGVGEAFGQLEALEAALDRLLVGQAEAKTAIALAVMTRQHALLEGPPGCGKTQLAEGSLRLMGGSGEVHLLSLHRDIRREDLVGETRLVRRPVDGSEHLEQISFDLVPGSLIRSPLLVLDDLGRAPGEALAPLLGLLAARRLRVASRAKLDQAGDGWLRLPLESAIATLALVGDERGAVDPLEPSQLDRFALQVRMRGLLIERRWAECGRVISQVCANTVRAGEAASLRQVEAGARSATRSATRSSTTPAGWTATERWALQRTVRSIPLPTEVLDRLSLLLGRLAQRLRDPRRASNSRSTAALSDRAFAAVLPQLLRAHAVLDRRGAVIATDLRVLRYTAARRIPESDWAWLEQEVEREIRDAESTGAVEISQVPVGAMMASDPDSETSPGAAGSSAVMTEESEVGMAELPPRGVPRRRPRPRPADVEPLIRALEGRLDRGRADLDDDPGGQPRGTRSLRRLDEILDADLVDLALLVDGTLAGPPRVLRRRRHTLGGAIIVARDVSSSMAGFRNDWANEVVTGLVRAAARRRLRVGYLEFHQCALPRPVRGRLLHRAYAELERLVRDASPMGQTNYEAPLRLALETLRRRRGANRHIVMLTDGLPILGDTQVRRERALARRLGVSLHTVFIGDGDCPPVLDAISAETGGLRFQARERAGGLSIVERPGIRVGGHAHDAQGVAV